MVEAVIEAFTRRNRRSNAIEEKIDPLEAGIICLALMADEERIVGLANEKPQRKKVKANNIVPVRAIRVSFTLPPAPTTPLPTPQPPKKRRRRDAATE